MSLVLGIRVEPVWHHQWWCQSCRFKKNQPTNPTLWFWRTVKCLPRVTVKASPWREYKEDPQDKVNDYIWSFWPVSFREFSLLNFTPSQLGTLPTPPAPPSCIPCLEGWIFVSELEFFLGPSCPGEGRGGEWASSRASGWGRLFLPSFVWIPPHPHAWGSSSSSPGPLFLLRAGMAASWNVDALAWVASTIEAWSLLLGRLWGLWWGWVGVTRQTSSVTPGPD